MPQYVDGLVVPVPKGRLHAYRHMARETRPFDAKRMILGGFEVLVEA